MYEMTDFKKIPRQHGVSDTPMHETNPRRFARTRCENAMNMCDKIIIYMGEIIQTYTPENNKPTDMVKSALEIQETLTLNGINIDEIFDYLNSSKNVAHGLGQFGGYILIAAIIMKASENMRNSLADLRSRI